LILGAGEPFCPWSHSRLRTTAGSAHQSFAENCKRPSSSTISSANARWREHAAASARC